MTDRQTNLSGVWGPRLGRGGPNRGGLAVSASLPYSQKIINLFGSSIVAYWPMSEASGTVSTDIGGRGHNGAYTGVTLAQTGIGDERTSASFDGSTSYNNVYSAGLNTDFNGNEFTFSAWIRVPSASVWTDTVARYIGRFQVDASNYFYLAKLGTGTLYAERAGGGTAKAVQSAVQSVTTWQNYILTISKTDDKHIVYLNGAQIGATQTGLGLYAGSLSATIAVIGAAATTPSGVWSGILAHALLLNRAATAAEVLAMATLLS